MSNVIDDDRLRNICKAGQGAECCRYIGAGHDGIRCRKHTSLRTVLDKKACAGEMTAVGDNCAGLKP